MLRRGVPWVAIVLVLPGLGAAPAAAVGECQYLVHDYGTATGVRNILPSGEAGVFTLADYLQHNSDSSFYPPHAYDQRAPYDGPTFTAPGQLTPAQLQQFSKEETFGVADGQVESTETPRPGLTILRDKAFGVPHIFATSRELAEYGAGWVSAEDRLFEMDVLRHAGRGNLASLVGSSGYSSDCGVHYQSGYDAADEATQKATLSQLDPSIVANAQAFADGVNGWVQSPGFVQHMPVEYLAFTPPVGPNAWKMEDIGAVGALIGSQLGGGGGSEVANTLAYQKLVATYGAARGQAIFDDLHAADSPESPTTIDAPFPYEGRAARNPASRALITAGPTDPNGCKQNRLLTIPALVRAAPPASPGAKLDQATRDRIQSDASAKALDIVRAVKFRKKASNAQVVNASHSASGHPIADFGPQAAYFTPEIFMEMDVHAPDWDNRGFQFPGTGVFVELGRGQDFAWSATSAGSDNIDQRVELLCNPSPAAGQGPLDNVDPNSTSYWYKGRCLPMVEKDVQYPVPFSPGTAPPGEIWTGFETFHVERTVHDDGIAIVQGRTTAIRNGATVPVAVSTQRTNFFHELDQAVGFQKWNTVSQVHDAKSFIAAAASVDTTFNWFYVDAHDTAYFSSGKLPVRNPEADPDLLNWATGEWDWQGWLPASMHPQAISPPKGWMTSWNNRPAPHWGSSDSNWDYGATYRSQLLDRELTRRLAATGGKLTPADLFNVMQVGSLTDFRAQQLLGPMLAIIGSTTGLSPAQQSALAALRAWHAAGDLRQDLNRTGRYANAAGIAVFDAMFPHVIHGVFNPWLKSTADPAWCSGSAGDMGGIPKTFDNPPSDGTCYGGFGGYNVGSSFDGGWQDALDKDFRLVTGQPVLASRPDTYCGGHAPPAPNAAPTDGDLNSCRAVLLAALDKGIAQQEDPVTLTNRDKIQYRSLGLFALPDEQWANKPTAQQFVEFAADRQSPRAAPPARLLTADTASLPNTATATGSWWLLAGLALAAASLPGGRRKARSRRGWPARRTSR
ncbi:MAG: penicillin acylase family protein [Candidatus Dormibacteria bacterium]